MCDQADGKSEECFVDVVASFPADAQAVEAVEPGDGALDDVADDAQAGAVGLASLRNHRADPALPEQATVLVVVVAAVGQQRVRASARFADPARDGRDLVEQRQELGDVVAVSAGQRHRERDALAVDNGVVLAARPSSVDRAGPASGPLSGRADVRGVDHRPGPVRLVLRAQLLQQHDMELILDAGLVPCGQPSPAGHAGYEARFLGQVLPLHAGVQDEQDPAQGLPVRHSMSALDQFRTWCGQQRLDERPQFIRHDPRTRLTFPHNQTTEQTSQQSHDQELLLEPVMQAPLTTVCGQLRFAASGHPTESRLAASGDTALMFRGAGAMGASAGRGYGQSTILPWACPVSSSRNASRTRSSG